jgi:adenine deaminase
MTDLQSLIRAARGVEPADLVFKGGRIFNVFTGEMEAGDLAVKGGRIAGLGRYQGLETVSVEGRILAPGFIEPHFHLESARLHPAELARVVVPRGTTTLVADPHEIANVLGLKGIEYLIEAASGLPLDVFFMAPSCVPATGLETSGAELDARSLAALLDRPRVLGLAEMMNYPGVLAASPQVLDKIALFAGRPRDGHAPRLTGPDLSAYLASGLSTDHECTTLEEAREKLARGMRIFMREGSTAKNLAALAPLVTNRNLRRIGLCSDDRHADDLLAEGHLDHLLRRAVGLGISLAQALILLTLNAAEAYGLEDRGALAPGRRADVVVLNDDAGLEVARVYKDGRLVAANGECLAEIPPVFWPDWASPMNPGPLDLSLLKRPAAGRRARVIELVKDQLLTEAAVVEAPVRDGFLAADPAQDLARLVVVERHHGTGRVGHGLVRGLGLERGALASTVAHDSHNIIAAGVSEEELLLAIAAVAKMRGGLAVVVGDQVAAELPLPIAGLMSPAPAAQVASAGRRLAEAARLTGCQVPDPFMILSFLALPVIPKLKLTDKGLVDVDRFEIVDLFLD